MELSPKIEEMTSLNPVGGVVQQHWVNPPMGNDTGNDTAVKLNKAGRECHSTLTYMRAYDDVLRVDATSI